MNASDRACTGTVNPCININLSTPKELLTAPGDPIIKWAEWKDYFFELYRIMLVHFLLRGKKECFYIV